jgi:hypothetical protein
VSWPHAVIDGSTCWFGVLLLHFEVGFLCALELGAKMAPPRTWTICSFVLPWCMGLLIMHACSCRQEASVLKSSTHQYIYHSSAYDLMLIWYFPCKLQPLFFSILVHRNTPLFSVMIFGRNTDIFSLTANSLKVLSTPMEDPCRSSQIPPLFSLLRRIDQTG